MKKLEVPYHKQNDVDHCGPCALSMILEKFGSSLTQEEITNTILKQHRQSTRRNTYAHDMVGYLADNGFGSLYIANLTDEKTWKIFKTYIRKNYPILVLMQYSKLSPRSHFRVITGHEFIENRKDHWIYFHDPHDGPNKRLLKKEFFELMKAEESTDQGNVNVFLVIQKGPFNIPEDKCNFCQSDRIISVPLPYTGPQDYSYVNKNTKLNSQCKKLACENCNAFCAIANF